MTRRSFIKAILGVFSFLTFGWFPKKKEPIRVWCRLSYGVVRIDKDAMVEVDCIE